MNNFSHEQEKKEISINITIIQINNSIVSIVVVAFIKLINYNIIMSTCLLY